MSVYTHSFIPSSTPHPSFIHASIHPGKTAQAIQEAAAARGVNVRVIDSTSVGLAFGETITKADVGSVLAAFGVELDGGKLEAVAEAALSPLPQVGGPVDLGVDVALGGSGVPVD